MSFRNVISELLSRDAFRDGVFRRDGYKCVLCGRVEPIDAHHIMERRLWDDGGYYLDNGATLCDDHDGSIGCHKKAEQTVISCDEIRAATGIRRVLLPDHLYRDNTYDKWGNITMPDGTRVKGELYHDESVRKVLASGGVLPLFRDRVKYPRTYHLPWSAGKTDDDRVLDSTGHFSGRQIIITEKMDGENTTMYHDYIHTRSLESSNHPSRGWVKNLHPRIQSSIPIGWRLCGENLFAKHTLRYDDLPSYFMLFSLWDENNLCLSWDETVEYAAVLDLVTVPVIYDGIWDEQYAKDLSAKMDLSLQEGFVVRVADAFSYGGFRRNVAKFVRREHVGTAHNWMMQRVERNGLRST
jgi:hypothetical protein